jgi:hypothetical protein
MKGASMRGTQVLGAAIIAAAAVISGCGQQHPGGGAAAPSPSASSSVTMIACGGALPAGHAGKLTITAADNDRSFCVTRGTAVTVLLKGTAARRWAPVHASPGALAPHANGGPTPPSGVTGASFVAVHPGTAVLTSARPACAPGTGTLSCGAIIAFRVTVTVVGLRD